MKIKKTKTFEKKSKFTKKNQIKIKIFEKGKLKTFETKIQTLEKKNQYFRKTSKFLK